ncbi:MAG TPA: XRE family transcriptional regulator [Deltaproteobacteria bacterium]|nr:XRE family transcriptional regulator [Deltaproteobacteria bacterium]
MSYAERTRLQTNARAIRRSLGLSREIVAARAGVGLETLRRLELGYAIGMKVETLLRIAAILGVSPGKLLPILEQPTCPDISPARRRTRLPPFQPIQESSLRDRTQLVHHPRQLSTANPRPRKTATDGSGTGCTQVRNSKSIPN